MDGKKYLEELLQNKFVIEEYKHKINEYVDNLQFQLKKQKEIINKIEEKIKKNIKNAKYEITTLTITDRVYYKYIDDMLDDLLQILEDKEV